MNQKKQKESALSSSELIIRKALAMTKTQHSKHTQRSSSPESKHFTITKKQITNEEATSVLENRRGYFMASTINHALHPDILSSQGQVGGDRFILCKLKEPAQKKVELEQEEKKEQIKEEIEDSKQGRNVGTRYFDTRVNAELICFHCKEAGHEARSCPNEYKSVITCSFCGLTDHLASQCPTKLVCYKCGQPGHKISECRERGVQVCGKCGKGGHSENNCLLFMENSKARGNRHQIRECVIEQGYQNYVVDGLDVQKILISSPHEDFHGDPESIEAFKFTKHGELLEEGELMTNLKTSNNISTAPAPKKKKTQAITLMCPICSGTHDFTECTSHDGNRTFERLYKLHPRYKEEGDGNVGLALFQQIYTRDYEGESSPEERRKNYSKTHWRNQDRDKGRKKWQDNERASYRGSPRLILGNKFQRGDHVRYHVKRAHTRSGTRRDNLKVSAKAREAL